MARNDRIRETPGRELLEQFEQAVRVALPAAWTLASNHEFRLPDGQADLVLQVTAPDGAEATILVEAKRRVEPRDLSSVFAQLREYSDAIGSGSAVLVAPFVSPATREALAAAGVGWFDATGNLRLRTDKPALYVDRLGADRNPFADPEDRRLRSLRGPAAARIVRALCEIELPLGVRSLADRAGVSIGSSARVLELLDREALIERTGRGQIASIRKWSLLRRWTEDYHLMTSNEVEAMLDPRGPEHLVAALRSSGADHVVSGSVAARAYLPDGTVPVVPLTTLIVHTERPADLVHLARLRSADRGANVFVVRPFDEVILSGARRVDGLACAAPPQVVADLLTGPGRSSEEAEQLVRHLADLDQGWNL